MSDRKTLHVIRFAHPLGTSAVAAGPRGVRRVLLDAADLSGFQEMAEREGFGLKWGGGGPAEDPVRQIRQYLDGRRRTFRINLDMRGTPFQLQVWRALGRVPFGKTVTYSELAQRAGRPGAARAVGSACGANPLPIVVPCHRVLAAGSRLGGFSGGLDMKRGLLDIEDVHHG